MSTTTNELIAYAVSAGICGAGLLLSGFFAFAPGSSKQPFGAYRTALLSFLASLLLLYSTTSKLVETGNFLRLDAYEYDYSWGIGLAVGALFVFANVPGYLWHGLAEGYAALACALLAAGAFVFSGLTSTTEKVNWAWFAVGAFSTVLAMLLLWFYRARAGWKALFVLVFSTLLVAFLVVWHALSLEQSGVLSFEQELFGKLAATACIVLILPVFMLWTYRDVPAELLREATPIDNSTKRP